MLIPILHTLFWIGMSLLFGFLSVFTAMFGGDSPSTSTGQILGVMKYLFSISGWIIISLICLWLCYYFYKNLMIVFYIMPWVILLWVIVKFLEK